MCAQAFPPLLKNAGGVSKRYFTLCRALIDGLGWEVTLVSPVNVAASGESDVDRWLKSGQLQHVLTKAVQMNGPDGTVLFFDIFSIRNTCTMLRMLCCGKFDVHIIDDVPFRLVHFLLVRGCGLPSITTTHTDISKTRSYKGCNAWIAWRLHLASARVVTVHASVSKVFADLMRERYWVPVQAIWPPILWSGDFRKPLEDFQERAANVRASWISQLGFEPTAILLFAGRWSAEKRIHLLFEAVPEGCALVIVGDSTSEYADTIEASRRRHVLPLRRMLHSEELRTAYAASDLFVSASDFETLGNVVIEAWCAGTPVAVQPAQGHLEFVEDGVNSYFVDFDKPDGARRRLEEIVKAGARVAVQPALDQLGLKLRTQDFPKEVREALFEPALAAGAAWRHCCRCCLLEPLIRLACLMAWFLLWLLLGSFTRIFYCVSCDPRFKSLSLAGGVVEPPNNPTGTEKANSLSKKDMVVPMREDSTSASGAPASAASKSNGAAKKHAHPEQNAPSPPNCVEELA